MTLPSHKQPLPGSNPTNGLSKIMFGAPARTKGENRHTRGSDGHWIADTSVHVQTPSYAQLSITNAQVQVWTNLANDPRSLVNPGSDPRIAAAWTTTGGQNSAFTLSIQFTDSAAHQVALYCADWLGTGNVAEKVEVFEASDSSFANPLDARSAVLPSNGVFWVWRFSGHKILRVTNLTGMPGNKAMVSAIFFDP